MKKIFVTRKLLKENEDKLKKYFDVKLNSSYNFDSQIPDYGTYIELSGTFQ